MRDVLSNIRAGVVIGVAAGMLPGCFPYVMSYVYLDGPGVTYQRAPCQDGAPVGVAYELTGRAARTRWPNIDLSSPISR